MWCWSWEVLRGWAEGYEWEELFERRSLVLLLSGWVSILLGWRYLMIW